MDASASQVGLVSGMQLAARPLRDAAGRSADRHLGPPPDPPGRQPRSRARPGHGAATVLRGRPVHPRAVRHRLRGGRLHRRLRGRLHRVPAGHRAAGRPSRGQQQAPGLVLGVADRRPRPRRPADQVPRRLVRHLGQRRVVPGRLRGPLPDPPPRVCPHRGHRGEPGPSSATSSPASACSGANGYCAS